MLLDLIILRSCEKAGESRWQFPTLSSNLFHVLMTTSHGIMTVVLIGCKADFKEITTGS